MKIKTIKQDRDIRYFIIVAGVIALVIIYGLLFQYFGIGFRCLWHSLTGWYCPGCGTTRMLVALLQGDLYQAFRYNALVFMLLPFGIFLLGNSLICRATGRKPLINRLPSGFWIVLIIITLLFGLVRNLPQFQILAPTTLGAAQDID